MAYKFQLGTAKLGGNIQMAGGTSISGSITNSVADDATVDSIVTEIDVGGLPADKLALATNPALEAVNQGGVEKLQLKIKANSGITKDGNGVAAVANANGSVQVDSNGIGVTVSANKGITHDGSSGLQVLIEGNKGLSVGASGLATVPNANESMQVGASGLGVKISANKGLSHDGSAGLQLRVANNKGLELASGELAMDIKANSGLVFDGNELAVSLQSDALQFDGAAIDLKDTIAGNRTFSGDIIVGGNFQVNGSTVTLSASNLLIEDKIIQVAKDATSQATSKDSGLLFGAGSADGARFLYEVDGSDQILKAKQGSGTTLIKMQASEFLGPATQGAILDENNVNTARRVLFANATGPQDFKSDADLTYNSGLNGGTFAAPRFSGNGQDLTNITSDSLKRTLLTADGTANVTVGAGDMGKILVFTGNVSNSGAGRQITLPAHDAGNVGKSILIKVSNAQSEPIVVARNANTDKIDGQASNLVLQSDNAAVELIYLGNGAGNLEWIIV